MARQMSIEYEGDLYNITTLGNAGQDICYTDKVFQMFLEILNEMTDRYRWIIHTCCLTSNHFHLLTKTPLAYLSSGIRRLQGICTHRFNEGVLFGLRKIGIYG